MEQCPQCGSRHRTRPKQCLIEVAISHNLLCNVGLKGYNIDEHSNSCKLKSMREYCKQFKRKD